MNALKLTKANVQSTDNIQVVEDEVQSAISQNHKAQRIVILTIQI